jgi:beta-N-acetylhexosaminidase
VAVGVLRWRAASSAPVEPPPAVAAPPAVPAAPSPPARTRPACTQRAAALPLRARLAQRLMVGVDPTIPGSARAVVAADAVGGVFAGGNATAILRDHALSGLRTAAGIPVAVAVDDEGGRVQRIDDLDGPMPSAREMAATMTPAQVRALAQRRGERLRARGITVDLAPVLDTSSQPANTVIGDRSFSADPATVSRYAGAFAAGLRDAGVLPVFKHFPGHGRASGDSHAGLVSTPPLSTLRGHDLLPYRDLLGSSPASVMIGHLDVPGLTDGLPASLSPAAYRLLRTDYHFSGVTITDDLAAMRAVSDRYTLPEAVLAAFRAGADVALSTATTGAGPVLDRLQAAVAEGRLSEADVNSSVARILAAKGWCTP